MENLFTLKEVIGWSISAFIGGAAISFTGGFILGKFFVKPEIQMQEPKEPFLLDDTCQVPCIDRGSHIGIKRYMFGDECKTVACYYLENKTECKIKKKHKPDSIKCEYL